MDQMNELLARIQGACLNMSFWHLVLPGIAAVILGLFLWLGGARHASLVIGLLGAIIGAAVGLFVSQWLDIRVPIAIGTGAAVFAIAAVLFQNTVILILASIIFAVACGSTYMSYAFNKQTWQDSFQRAKQKALEHQNFNEGETNNYLDNLQPDNQTATPFLSDNTRIPGSQKLQDILEDVRATGAQNRNMLIVWIIVGAAVGLTVGYLLKKILMALCCSIVGASGVIAGMSALLFAKGVEVFSSLHQRPRLMPTLLIAMIIFGCFVQLLLAAGKDKTKKSSTQQKGEKEK